MVRMSMEQGAEWLVPSLSRTWSAARRWLPGRVFVLAGVRKPLEAPDFALPEVEPDQPGPGDRRRHLRLDGGRQVDRAPRGGPTIMGHEMTRGSLPVTLSFRRGGAERLGLEDLLAGLAPVLHVQPDRISRERGQGRQGYVAT
jgi:hypothetical protein